MPSNLIQAFVSSTYEDLKDHRAHVINEETGTSLSNSITHSTKRQ
jgi:hypothetical protein